MNDDPEPSAEFTRFLAALSSGDRDELEHELMPRVYGELRAIADACMRGQRPDQTLQPTALVNEAYLKIFHGANVPWKDRGHFYATAAKAMRQLLIDHARARGRLKRGGERLEVTLDVAIARAARMDVDILDMDDALSRLRELDPRGAEVVELRFFAGLEMAEIAQLLEVSLSSVERDWRSARAWLGTRLGQGSGS